MPPPFMPIIVPADHDRMVITLLVCVIVGTVVYRWVLRPRVIKKYTKRD